MTERRESYAVKTMPTDAERLQRLERQVDAWRREAEYWKALYFQWQAPEGEELPG